MAQEVMEREKLPNLIAQDGSEWGWRCLGEEKGKGEQNRADECFEAAPQRKGITPWPGKCYKKGAMDAYLGVMAALSCQTL